MTTDAKFLPNEKEIKALQTFVQTDITRAWMTSIRIYESETGATCMATDGHTIAIRRSGSHREMSLYEIEKLQCRRYDDKDPEPSSRWASLITAPDTSGKHPGVLRVNPFYFARVGAVEIAAGKRDANDYVPPNREAAKVTRTRKHRENLKTQAVSTWVIPSKPLDGWYWKVNAKSALWEGIIMPRRV